MTAPAIGVCGYGRCGSTMVMMMLVAGGMTPVDMDGTPPHELPDIRQAWHRPLAGQAVKLLDSALYFGIPPAPAWRFVWLDRNTREQAKSHAKFLAALDVIPPGDRAGAARRFEASYRRDRSRVLDLLGAAGEVLVLTYEQVLADPAGGASRLREVWPDLDVAGAASVVHKRDGRCRPDLSVETSMVGSA